MVTPVPAITVDGKVKDTGIVCTDVAATLGLENPDAGVTYSWWDAASGGTQLGSGTSYAVPTGQALGYHTYYVQAVRNGCATAYERRAVVLDIVKPQAALITEPTKDTSICLGQSVVLEASSAQDSATFNWYTVASGGTPIRSSQDTIHVTPLVTTTYYVETSLGGCVSDTRTPLTVTVTAAPNAPEVVPDTAWVTTGQTATFSVVDPDNALVYRWYKSATGGVAVHTGTDYTTHGILADSVFYVEADNPGGCVSPRTEVIARPLAVNGSVPCYEANTQQSPIYSGGAILNLSILNGVLNPGYAVDGDPSTASNIRVNVDLGIGTHYLGQLLSSSTRERPVTAYSLYWEPVPDFWMPACWIISRSSCIRVEPR